MLVSSQCQNVTRHVTSASKHNLRNNILILNICIWHLTLIPRSIALLTQHSVSSCKFSRWAVSLKFKASWVNSQHLQNGVKQFSIDVTAYHKAVWDMHGISNFETLLNSSKSRNSHQTNWKLFFVIFSFLLFVDSINTFYLKPTIHSSFSISTSSSRKMRPNLWIRF